MIAELIAQYGPIATVATCALLLAPVVLFLSSMLLELPVGRWTRRFRTHAR